MAFQNFGRGDKVPCRRNCVLLDTDFLVVATVTYHLAIHLKDINQWEVKFIKEVFDSYIGAERTTIVLLGRCSTIGYISVSDSRLRKADITKEITSVCGRQAVQ